MARKRKLKLNRETLRNLSPRQMMEAVGADKLIVFTHPPLKTCFPTPFGNPVNFPGLGSRTNCVQFCEPTLDGPCSHLFCPA